MFIEDSIIVGEITREEFHRMYGGIVGENDFDKEITIAEMERRITSDFKFDRRCQENCEAR